MKVAADAKPGSYSGIIRIQIGPDQALLDLNLTIYKAIVPCVEFVKFAMKEPNKKRSQIMIVTSAMDIDRETLFKIIRARLDIENCIFNNLKRECGLEHCYVYGGKAVEAILNLIFIASNIIQLFYFRRIRKSISTQRELVRLLFKGFYLLKYRIELTVNSS